MIRGENISLKLGEKPPDISLVVDPRICGSLGPNGAGKSTC